MDFYEHCELLCLHLPSKVSEMCDSVPKPDNSVPPVGLPIWNEMQLDAKLPVMTGPKGANVFSRDKLGQKLWKSNPDQDFILYDPNCYDVSYKYEPLHDENLRVFFSKKRNFTRVWDLGLITPDSRAICTLKEFNEYRRYLKRLYLDSVHKEWEFRDELEDERRKLKKAREYAERDIQRAKKADYMREKCRPAREERLRQEEERKRREEIRRERNERCQRHLEEKKRLLEASLQERFRAFETKIRHRVNNAKLIARYRKILTLRRWNASEQERKERQEREILEKKQQKERSDLERWYAKVQMQTERLKREKEIIRENQRQIAVRVAERSKMVERERERMDELLVEIKKKRRKSDEKRKSLALLRAITKVLEEKKGTAEAPATHLVEKTLQQTLAELRNLPEGNEPLVILSNTREKLEKEAGLPEEVTNVIDELLGRALKEHIRRTLHKLLSSTINRAMELKTKPKEDDKKLRRRSGSLLTTKPTRSKSITISERQASQLLSERKRSVTSGDVKVTRGVSFGGAIAIDEAAEGITEGRVPSSVRERPPTPVPSLTSLAEAVFEEPEFLEIVNTSEVEKEKLQKLIVNLSKILFSNVLEKTSRDERKFRSFRSFRNAAVNLDKKLNDVVTRVTEKILKESDEEVLDSDEIQYAMDSLSREVARAVLHQQELNRISSMTRTPSIMKRNG